MFHDYSDNFGKNFHETIRVRVLSYPIIGVLMGNMKDWVADSVVDRVKPENLLLINFSPVLQFI